MPEELKVTEPVIDPNVSVVEEPKLVNLKDDDLVEIIWKGEKIQKPWKEARANVQFQEDYTRSKQALTSRAKEMEELFTGLQAKERELKEKELAIDKILGRSPEPRVEPDDPEEVLTRGQLQAILKDHTETLSKRFESTVDTATRQGEEYRVFQRLEDLTTDTVEALVKENPLLEDIPHLALVLKREALEEKPTNERDMVKALVKVGKHMADKLDARYNERKKAEVVKRQQLVEKGTERTGGRQPFEAPKKDYLKKNSRRIDWDAIEKDAIAATEALEE